LWNETFYTYSQTLNGSETTIALVNCCLQIVIDFSGPFLVSRTGDAEWTERQVKMPKWSFIRTHKRCNFIQTVWMWLWKLESFKECLTTHKPNKAALKMNGA